MFGPVGWQEILLILVLALLVFGPRRLPELGRTLGRALAEFRRATADLKRTLNAEIALEDDERPRTPRRPELAAPKDPSGDPTRSDLWSRPEGRAPAATMPRGADALDLAGVAEGEGADPEPPAGTAADDPASDAGSDDAGPDAAPADREPATTTH